MQKIAKLILIACGVLALVVIAVALSANLYIESKDTQTRIERKIGRVLHVPVKITATRFSLWTGLQVNGITVPQDSPDAGNFFEAASFTAELEYWPLTKRHLAIRRISIAEPQLVWYQSAKGKWKAPSYPESTATASGTNGMTNPPSPKRAQVKPFEVTVDKMALHDGLFRFYDHDKNSLLAFSGVNGEGRLVSASEAHGKAESAALTVRDAVKFKNLRTDFSYANKSLELKAISAKIAGGDLKGDFQMNTAAPANPFVLKAQFGNVDVNRMVVEGGGANGQVSGLLSGELNLQSKTHKFKDFRGTGKLDLAHGKIQQYDLFQMLGQALQIEELRQLNLQKAHVEFHCDDGKAFIDQLQLQSPNIRLSATGTIRLDGKMSLDARLAINHTIGRQLPGFVADNFHPLAETGGDYQYIDFEVTGSVQKPRTNLLEIALGKKIEKEVSGLFNSLFGGKKKKEPKKAAQEAAQPEPEVGAAPSAPALPASGAPVSPSSTPSQSPNPLVEPTSSVSPTPSQP